MRYMGGKHRQSKAITEALAPLSAGQYYYEPFCGALGSASAVVPHFEMSFLSDASKPLITMWQAMLDGWEPPSFVSEDLYKKYADKRHAPDAEDPLTAWMGYAMSFGGKWFGGYARQAANDVEGTKRSQANQKRAALSKIAAVRGKCKLACMDYIEAIENIRPGSVVYLDPPYADRTRAHHTSKGFNHADFWDRAKKLSEHSTVFVSEFIAPKGWAVVHSWGDTVVRHKISESDGTNECLFRLEV